MSRSRLFVVVLVSVAAGLIAVGVSAQEHVEADDVWFGPGDDGTATGSVVLENHGSVAVQVTAVDVVGGDADQFSFIGTTKEVSPGGSATFEFEWEPISTEPVSTTASFTHDGPGSPLEVTLAGGAPFTLSTGNLDLGSVNVAQPELDDTGMNSIGTVDLIHSGDGFPDQSINFETSFGSFVARIQGGQTSTVTATDPLRTFRIGFHPEADQDYLADFEVASPEWTETVALSGTGITSPVLYRVNAGGDIVDVDGGADQSFTQDVAGNRSPFFVTGGILTDSTSDVISRGSGVPPEIPLEVFETDRWAGVGDISYRFPVSEAGPYLLRLYFAEIHHNSAGQRSMDVEVEGAIATDGLDILAEAGGHDVGIATTYLVDPTDGAIDVALVRGTENPKISALEVVGEPSVDPGQLAASDADFGEVEVAAPSASVITVSNGAPSGEGTALRIDGLTFAGDAAADFTVASGLPVWVAPGESVNVEVTIEASTVGTRTATATFDIWGLDGGPSVALTAEAVPAPPPGEEPPDDGEPGDDPEPGDAEFIDDDDSIFEDDIEWLARVGITRGCNPPENDRFCPDENVTRGQMAAFFVRALGLTDAGAGDLFGDDDGSVFESDIDRLATAGITRGCNPPENDRFCPEENVTRGQMAAFFVRALGLTDAGSGDLFGDDNGSVFESDIDRLATAGITRGCNPPDTDRFCPDENVTRGQMAAFFHRAAELMCLPD